MSNVLGYTTWGTVTSLLNRTFPEITPTEQNTYLGAAERVVENFLGYNEFIAGTTTASGILSASIAREKSAGHVDAYGNIVIQLKHPPIQLDSNGNPQVTALYMNGGVYEVTLPTTDGTTNARNSILEVDNNRRKVYFPASYSLPFLTQITPTAKFNLFNLRDFKFWTDISYIGGYTVVPDTIALATAYLAAEYAMHRDNPNFLFSFTQGTMSQTFAGKSTGKTGVAESHFVLKAKELLQPYVRVSW